MAKEEEEDEVEEVLFSLFFCAYLDVGGISALDKVESAVGHVYFEDGLIHVLHLHVVAQEEMLLVRMPPSSARHLSRRRCG